MLGAARTAAAGGSPRRLRGSPASAQLAVHFAIWPARLQTRPRRGSVAAVLPHWSHGDRRLPDGRLTRPLPPPVKGHGRDAWCEYRSGTAGRRWRDGSRVRLPGQPASRLDPHALVGQVQRWPIQRPIGARFGHDPEAPPSTGLVRDAVAVVGAVRPSGRAPGRPKTPLWSSLFLPDHP